MVSDITTEGDHIKVTASQYPFPTVCADKQSTDWFHAISRTLKWNERERQKSFVVVEEGPAKPRSRKHTVTNRTSAGIPESKEEDNEEDEDEVSDDEEEKFDIDDSSAAPSLTNLLAMDKTREEEEKRAARKAAAAMGFESSPFRHRSRSRGGIETPDRFAGAHPHPPMISPRHVNFDLEGKTDLSLSRASSTDSVGGLVHEAAKGDRDHIHSPQLLSGGRSRIPRDRDVDADSMKTPTFQDGQSAGAMRRGHSSRRAFACWGQDESDSNASDSDASISEHASTPSRRNNPH